MKVMSSRDAQNAFGQFLDTAQSEAVMVTRRDRPVGVMVPIDNLDALFDLTDSMRKSIEAGVKAGIADAEAGRGEELTDDYVAQLTQEMQTRIDTKKQA